MSQLNIKTINSGDLLSTVIDKINDNFSQIVLNGGGPGGLRGFLGGPGFPGKQGILGPSGGTGAHGTYLYTSALAPSLYTFGASGEASPRLYDVFLEGVPNYVKIWQNSLTGSTGTYWQLINTVLSPNGSVTTAYDQSLTGPTATFVVNDKTVGGKLLIGTPFALGASGHILDYPSNPTKVVPALSNPVSFSDTLVTFASDKHQLRILSTDPAIGLTDSTNRILNGGGISHSLEISTGASPQQIYKIQNADVNGDKHFSVFFNNTGNVLFYANKSHNLSIGGTEFETLTTRLSINGGLAVGAQSFYQSATASGSGAVIQGGLAIGRNVNNIATLGVYAVGGSSSVVIIDSNSSSGVPINSSLSFATDYGLGTATSNKWTLSMDGYSSSTNTSYRALKLKSYLQGYSGLTGNDIMYFGMTGSGNYSTPVIGVGNSNPISTFEVGNNSSSNRFSIGGASADDTGGKMSSYIGFNMHRTDAGTWTRRGNGSTGNGGKAIWTAIDGGLGFSFYGTTAGTTATGFATDTQVYENTSLYIRDTMGLIMTDKGQQNAADPDINYVPLTFHFGATGTAGNDSLSSVLSERFRRFVAVFGDGYQTGSLGTPMISTVASILTQTDTTIIYPQYTFANYDGVGLYLTYNNLPVNGSSGYESGIAYNKKPAISIQQGYLGSSDLKIGVGTRNVLEKFQIGELITLYDGETKFWGFNSYYDNSYALRKRIIGSTASGATQHGAARITMGETAYGPNSGTFTTFKNWGGRLGFEVDKVGASGTTGDASSISGNIYRGVMVSAPATGPASTWVNVATNVPQVKIGLANDIDPGGTTLKRGTISTASQFRLKPFAAAPMGTTIEDYYNYGLYSFDGYPVAGIAGLGGNPSTNSTKSFEINFLGATGSLYEDVNILAAQSNIDFTSAGNLERIASFGAQIRLGVGTVPTLSIPSTSPYNYSSLTIGGFSGPSAKIAGIFKNITILDQNADGNGGLYFKDVAEYYRGSTVPDAGTYSGDFFMQFWGFTNSDSGRTKGLNIGKPYGSSSPGNYKLFISDDGCVGVGYDDSTTPRFSVAAPFFYKDYADGATAFTYDGFGVNRTTKLSVNGKIDASQIIIHSDRRLKSEINDITDSLEKVLRLKPSTYVMDNSFESGFIAQDVAEVIPHIVYSMSDERFEGGKLMLDYKSFIPYLAGAIQEQQKTITKLSDTISKMEELLKKHNII